MKTSARQLSIFLVLGVSLGLLLTACAGVAAGQVDLPGSTILGPAVDVLTAPGLNLFPARSDMHLRSAELSRPVAVEMNYGFGWGCERGGHGLYHGGDALDD